VPSLPVPAVLLEPRGRLEMTPEADTDRSSGRGDRRTENITNWVSTGPDGGSFALTLPTGGVGSPLPYQCRRGLHEHPNAFDCDGGDPHRPVVAGWGSISRGKLRDLQVIGRRRRQGVSASEGCAGLAKRANGLCRQGLEVSPRELLLPHAEAGIRVLDQLSLGLPGPSGVRPEGRAGAGHLGRAW
jgi:hypothetical protein